MMVRKAKGEFEEVKVRTSLERGFGEVTGVRLHDHFALTPDESGRLSIITHLPSGLRVPSHMGKFTLAGARVYISRLMTLPIDWSDGDWRMTDKVRKLTDVQIAMLCAPIVEVES